MGQQYNPSNTVISVVGSIEHAEVTHLVNQEAHDWTPRPGLDWERVIPDYSGPTVKIDNRSTDQSHICLGMEGLSLFDPDRFALALLNCALGDGMSSRLFLSLREDQGLAYDVSSSVNNFKDCGSLIIYCGTEPRKIDAAITTIMAQLHLLLYPMKESELRKSKEYTKGTLLLRMEDTRAVASWLGTQELLMGHILKLDEVVDLIDKTDLSDIHRVATRLITDRHLRLAIVGPHEQPSHYKNMLQFS
jgi:predicted Zn-dependent peptidase